MSDSPVSDASRIDWVNPSDGRQPPGAESPRRIRRSGRWPVALVIVALVAVGAACAPDEPPPDPYGLRTTLTDGGIVLEWHAPEGSAADSYDLRWSTTGLTWTDLPRTSATTATFEGVADRTMYMFQVRSAATPSDSPGEWSPPAESLYVDLHLPVVRIETAGRVPILDKTTKIGATMRLEPNGSTYAPFEGTIEIRGRGNSTWNLPKKPYRVDLDVDSELMGMPSHDKWVLLANAFDRSQLHNWTAARVSEAAGLPYTPRSRHVELVLNGQYVGVYQLGEDPDRIDPNRVAITKMKKGDIAGTALTGGYLLEIDQRLEENAEPGFRTTHGVPVVVKEPDPAAPEQAAYIHQRVQAFEDALFSPDFADPETGYRAYLDVPNFIDHYLVQEVMRNEDAFWSSTFFTKDRGDDRFRFGPVWDFDLSLGRTIISGFTKPPEGFHVRGRMPWTTRIFEDPAFVAQVSQRWDQLRPLFAGIATQLEPYGTQLRPAIGNDEVRWDYTVEPFDQPQGVADFLNARIAWLDAQY